uniref:LAGLIDADG endonuclease n=1 Tax=Powellomyces hirtus TaxID=109895 RepID=A0A4P8NWU5_9FUNG|nr:LAGLIDADG endonuclease [Powellomyces hirtus]
MPTTRGQSAGVRHLATDVKAPQRLDAKDLVHAYIVGLIEGDGFFMLTKNGKYIKYEFGIALNIRDVQLIYKLKEILGVGVIDFYPNRKMVYLRVRNKAHLKSIILPIFDKFPMLSNKQYDYLRFKQSLLENVILYEDLPEYTRPSVPLNTVEHIINQSYFSAWLVGFIEAEGCFSLYKPAAQNNYVGSFDIGQTEGRIILEAIRTYLAFTPQVYLKANSKLNIFGLPYKDCFAIKVSSRRAVENIVKFLNKAPVKLLGYKKLQYILWLKGLRGIPKYNNAFKIPSNY